MNRETFAARYLDEINEEKPPTRIRLKIQHWIFILIIFSKKP